MDPAIAESILGHWFKEKAVSERYGRISDRELIEATDQMTFDHGETEILVASCREAIPVKYSEQNVNIREVHKKKAVRTPHSFLSAIGFEKFNYLNVILLRPVHLCPAMLLLGKNSRYFVEKILQILHHGCPFILGHGTNVRSSVL
jgi:hypothetical protein